MKSADAIKSALAKYETMLKEIYEKIEEDEEWKGVSRKAKNEELFVSLSKDIDKLTAQIPEMDFKVRFAKWVLE